MSGPLGEVLERELKKRKRFFDIFTGSGAVAIQVATRFAREVHASDLQSFSACLVGAVICRSEKAEVEDLWRNWSARAVKKICAVKLPRCGNLSKRSVTTARSWCREQVGLGITRAYGGHYFSPMQAVWIDALRSTLPRNEPQRTIALAALVQAVSRCAAAPGHTAQPFQPTSSGIKWLASAWSKSVEEYTLNGLKKLSTQYAKKIGKTSVADAVVAAKLLVESDLVFIDPPYSSVQYSRFYHVLESVTTGSCGEVSGVGRYPDMVLRPHSDFSLKTKSFEAMESLFKAISCRGARAIVTFPEGSCSNGLSGADVKELAAKYFRLEEAVVLSLFSSLGGSGSGKGKQAGRHAFCHHNELILTLKPI